MSIFASECWRWVPKVEESHMKIQEFQVSFAPSDAAGFSATAKQDDDGEGKDADEEMEKLIAVTVKYFHSLNGKHVPFSFQV